MISDNLGSESKIFWLVPSCYHSGCHSSFSVSSKVDRTTSDLESYVGRLSSCFLVSKSKIPAPEKKSLGSQQKKREAKGKTMWRPKLVGCSKVPTHFWAVRAVRQPSRVPFRRSHSCCCFQRVGPQRVLLGEMEDDYAHPYEAGPGTS